MLNLQKCVYSVFSNLRFLKTVISQKCDFSKCWFLKSVFVKLVISQDGDVSNLWFLVMAISWKGDLSKRWFLEIVISQNLGGHNELQRTLLSWRSFASSRNNWAELLLHMSVLLCILSECVRASLLRFIHCRGAALPADPLRCFFCVVVHTFRMRPVTKRRLSVSVVWSMRPAREDGKKKKT